MFFLFYKVKLKVMWVIIDMIILMILDGIFDKLMMLIGCLSIGILKIWLIMFDMELVIVRLLNIKLYFVFVVSVLKCVFNFL